MQRGMAAAPPAPLISKIEPELPDDALLEVFRWLSKCDLLWGVRGVCRRWRQVALHPSIWRNISLSFAEMSEFLATLRLAPCLRMVTLHALHCFPGQLLHQYLEAASTTCCAVSELSLDFPDATAEVMLMAKRVLKRQVELGRLRKLDLSVPRHGADDLVAIFLNSPIVDLHFQVNNCYADGNQEPLQATGMKGPLLKTLKYDSYTQDPLLEYMLNSSADCLQSVTIENEASSLALELLGNCSKLRQARLRTKKKLCSLQRCKNLTQLTLYPDGNMSSLLPFFRSATELTKLSFLFSRKAAHRSVLDLVLALGSSGGFALRELNICMFEVKCRDVAPVVLAVPLVLRGLPHLHTLHLGDIPPASALDAITPILAPCLRVLSFDSFHWWDDLCGDECCFPALYRLVQTHRRLHVVGLIANHGCNNGEYLDCDCCRKGLHPISNNLYVEHRSLYGHQTDEECELPAHRDNPGACLANFDREACQCKHSWINAGSSMLKN